MDEFVSFGSWLRARRRALDLTQAELASRVGCATSTLKKIEQDERRPSKDIAERLAEALALPAAEHAAFVQHARGLRTADQSALPRLPEQAAPAAVRRPPSNLPLPRTPVIGRAQELAQLQALLRRADVALVTLTGPGGTGKTRLAFEVAARLSDHFGDGVWVVNLAPVVDPELVVATIARALGVAEHGGEALVVTLGHYLWPKHLLLVLDNVEQVLDAAPDVAALLQAAPALTVLATSRAPLRLVDEHAFAVPPLTLPDPRQADVVAQVTQSEAGAFFVARAQAVQRAFRLTPANAPAIAAVCTRLDGLPLALELAATRSTLFPPQALLARLDRRFELLTGGARDLPMRQQTLRATIDWSYQLLAPAEQRLFARLAVFAGGWTIPAATAVCTTTDAPEPDVVSGLQALLDQNLLRDLALTPESDAAEPRFTMLETLRAYAAEVLETSGNAEAIRRRHAQYFLERAATVAHLPGGDEQLAQQAALEGEQENLRAALAWLLAQREVEAGLRLSIALRWLWLTRGSLREGRRWLEAFIARSDQVPVAESLRADAQVVAGEIAWMLGDGPGAIAVLEPALGWYESSGNQAGVARVLKHLGDAVERQGDPRRAATLLDRSLALSRALGDVHAIAEALRARAGLTAYYDGDAERAARMVEESLRLFRAAGDRREIAASLAWLGWHHHDRGDLAHGAQLTAEALALARELGDKEGILTGLAHGGVIAYRGGDVVRARQLLEEQLALAQAWGRIGYMAGALLHLAVTERYAGNLAQAEQRFEQRRRLPNWAGITSPFGSALERRYAGDLAFDQGEIERASQLYGESLAGFGALGHQWDCAAGIEAVAAVADARGAAGRAVRLWSAATAIREGINAPLPPVDRPRRDAALARLHTALGATPYDTAWAEGRALTLAQALGYALEPDPPPDQPPNTRSSGGEAKRTTTPDPESTAAGLVNLTGREREVLRLVAHGHSNRAIARALALEEGTVKRHLHSLLGKLEAHSRTGAVARARVLGLL